MRHYGSQGEHKLVLVALKLAEREVMSNLTGHVPIFLLDDVFAELDIQRSKAIVDTVTSGDQVLLTTTDLADLRVHGLEPNRSGTKLHHIIPNPP